MAKTDTAPVTEAPEVDDSNEIVKIMIASASGAGGKDDVYVGANGRSFLIQRDKEVPVPKIVVTALNLATITEYETDELGRFTGETREVPRYNVRVL